MVQVSRAAEPAASEDPLGLDAGPARDEQAFLEWVKAPRERPHPVMTFKNLVHHDPRLRPDYRAFLCRQASLKGKAARLVVALSEEVFLRDPLTTGDLVTLEDRLKLEASDKRVRELGKRFFREIPRARRLRIYKIAEKFQYARLAVIDMVRTGNKYAWMAGWKKLEWDREEGYLYGMENGKDAEYSARVDEDFKLTMDFILTFAGPPSYLDKPERERIRGERRKKRVLIIKGLRPFDL
jgi:hypothetical protein